MVHPKAMARPEITGRYRKKLQNIKNRMMQQCYDKNHVKYKNYGGRGVTVDKKWHRLKGFLEDFDQIDGWDEEKFLADKLQLDKDIKSPGNLLYSKETCMWVSPEENSKVKPSYQKSHIGVRVDGYKEEFTNSTEFRKRHPEVNRGVIPRVARGEAKYHNGWYFYYKGEVPNPPMVHKAEKEGEEPLLSFVQSELEKAINPETPTGTIHSMIHRGRTNYIEGWEISWYYLPC